MFSKKISPFLLLCIFSQCNGKEDDAGKAIFKQQHAAGATINDETNIFSAFIEEFKKEKENLKIVEDNKRQSELKKKKQKIILKSCDKCGEYVVFSLKKFLNTPMSEEGEKQEWVDRMKKELENSFMGDIYQRINDVIDDYLKKCIDTNKEYIKGENDRSAFTKEVENIFQQFERMSNFINSDDDIF